MRKIIFLEVIMAKNILTKFWKVFSWKQELFIKALTMIFLNKMG